MRISEKIEVDTIDDFFVGCEISSKLFAVIVGDFGHDDEAVASRIGLLGSWGTAVANSRTLCYRGRMQRESYTSGRDGRRRWRVVGGG
jgi:hypothetical protein